METVIVGTFRFVLYAFFGLTMEMVFSVLGIDKALGYRVERRVPRRYLEGFVSLYMIPLHGLGVLLFFEPAHDFVREWFIGARFCLWAVSFTVAEIAWGLLLEKTAGFFPWDYYAHSKYKLGARGYTLWTLIPQWGIAGLMLEVYSDLMLHLSPYVLDFFGRG